METKHTPGPWFYRPQKYDDWGVVRMEANGFICQANDPRFHDPDYMNECRRNGTDPWEANARLISAAPTMLEALEEARTQVAILQDRFGIKESGAGTLSIIDAALSKATGADQ